MLIGTLSKAAERDLWCLADELDSAIRAAKLPGCRQTVEQDDETFANLCDTNAAFGWFDDLESRLGVEIEEVRKAYCEWLRDYVPEYISCEC